jgi:hypothetical protein
MLAVRSSRWGEMFTGSWLRFFHPPRLTVTPDGVRVERVRSFFFPWMKEEELMSSGKIASVRHLKGMIWDSVVIETSGGSNNLEIAALRKRNARDLVAALHRLGSTTS